MATTTKAAQAATKGLAELFVDGLKDIDYAERKILKALPKMAKGADGKDVSAAFEKHTTETKEQIARLERVFDQLGERGGGKTCPAIDGILEEGEEILAEYKGSPALDAGLVAAAQAVEHYEIARYGTLIASADSLATVRPPNCSRSHSARKWRLMRRSRNLAMAASMTEQWPKQRSPVRRAPETPGPPSVRERQEVDAMNILTGVRKAAFPVARRNPATRARRPAPVQRWPLLQGCEVPGKSGRTSGASWRTRCAPRSTLLWRSERIG